MTDTTKTSSTRRAGAGRVQPTPAAGAPTVAVQFSGWGPQRYQVYASGGGGRQDLPYVAVTVGECLTYVYDRAALVCHVSGVAAGGGADPGAAAPDGPGGRCGWSAGRAGPDAGLHRARAAADRGHREVSPDGIGSISVVVGAVTVRALSSEAVRCYLLAWTRPEALGAILDAVPDSGELPS